MSVPVHQLLHGYSQGHQLLAGSLRLKATSSDLVRRLSDLSGPTDPETPTPPYLTVYSLEGEDYFAVARTWPDFDAPRDGCVLTHTLLIEKEWWMTAPTLRGLTSLFRHPYPEDDYSFYTKPLSYSIEVPDPDLYLNKDERGRKERRLAAFVQRFHREGRTFLVEFGEDGPETEDFLWDILESLWPQLRARFCACSYTLRPRRHLEQQFFNLMLAPNTAVSRFRSLPADNQFFAGQIDKSSLPDASWQHEWTELVATGKGWEWGTQTGLWHHLSEDPLNISHLFLLEHLVREGNSSPLSFVGALDVMDTLSTTQVDGIERKRSLVQQCLNILQTSNIDSKQRLQVAFLLADRLNRPEYKQFLYSEQDELIEYVYHWTQLDASTALELAERTFRDLSARSREDNAESLSSSPFYIGVALGFEKLVQEEPSILAWLHRVPPILFFVLNHQPNALVRYLSAPRYLKLNSFSAWLSATQISSFEKQTYYQLESPLSIKHYNESPPAEVITDLVDWLLSMIGNAQPGEMQLQALQPQVVALLQHLSLADVPNDIGQMRQLLAVVDEDSVEILLNYALLHHTDSQHSSTNTRQLILINSLTERFPHAVRHFAYLQKTFVWANPGMAGIAAATYQHNDEGLNELLSERVATTAQKRTTLSAWLQGVRHPAFPKWLCDRASQNGDFIHCLLESETLDHIATTQLSELVEQISQLRIASRPDLLPSMEKWFDERTCAKLRGLAMEDVLLAWKRGDLSERDLVTWNSSDLARLWARKISARQLAPLLTPSVGVSSFRRRVLSKAEGELVWKWIIHAPETLYQHKSQELADVVKSLVFSLSLSTWDEQDTEHWILIVTRARRLSNKAYMYLCNDALSFALSHVGLPLSSLVVEVFASVYEEVVESRHDAVDIEAWLGYLGWDKGKELRKQLVSCFMGSPTWLPGDLALTAERAGLLKKIFKRIARNKGGEEYIQLILRDLSRRQESSPRIAFTFEEFKRMSRYPDFIEPWD